MDLLRSPGVTRCAKVRCSCHSFAFPWPFLPFPMAAWISLLSPGFQSKYCKRTTWGSVTSYGPSPHSSSSPRVLTRVQRRGDGDCDTSGCGTSWMSTRPGDVAAVCHSCYGAPGVSQTTAINPSLSESEATFTPSLCGKRWRSPDTKSGT